MLRIIVHLGQQDLIPQLKAEFPDLSLEKRRDGVMHCLASLHDGLEGAQQLLFLHTHDLVYVDAERQRELGVRAFFHGVELEGKPIITLRFRPLRYARYWHVATLATDDDEINLHLPPEWSPGISGHEEASSTLQVH